MKYFETFRSNTYAGSGNQLLFGTNEGEVRTGRVFYKISAGGEYNYSLLFSNTMDSTYADGSVSHCNLICDEWFIHSARIGRCQKFDTTKPLSELVMNDSESSDVVVSDFKDISFGGQKSKAVMPGEFFTTDPLTLSFEKGDYLCLEMTFSGKMIPYHEETMLPVFVKTNGNWEFSKHMPFASMIGCDRNTKARIAYLGDSITQGIGATPNSYLHWNAVLSEKLGNEYSYWNLGIGYARASDAASDGAWLYKAKQNDIVFVCYGVNDILQNRPQEQIKDDLRRIAEILKKEGKKVIMQTVPPFDYNDVHAAVWNSVNDYILTEIKGIVDYVFDNRECLSEKEKPQNTIYGGHPNNEGCEVWANAFFEHLKKDSVL